MPITSKTELPSAFRRVTLELAREPGHPQGDGGDRYILVAPLRDDGRLDLAVAREHREACRFAREAAGTTRRGALVHGPGGRWSLRYDAPSEAGDEIAFRLDQEHLRSGEYVSVIRKDGDHPYRVTAVSAL